MVEPSAEMATVWPKLSCQLLQDGLSLGQTREGLSSVVGSGMTGPAVNPLGSPAPALRKTSTWPLLSTVLVAVEEALRALVWCGSETTSSSPAWSSAIASSGRP